MNIFDLDKNSLPEQVQKNKDDIKDIKDNLMPADLQAAKDYTDAHIVDSDHISSGTATNGQVLTANGNGDATWQTPAQPTITDGDIDSETSTAGQVLTSDGNGNASWQTPAQPTITDGDIDSETATAGQVLMADGNGGASWQSAGGGITVEERTFNSVSDLYNYLTDNYDKILQLQIKASSSISTGNYTRYYLNMSSNTITSDTTSDNVIPTRYEIWQFVSKQASSLTLFCRRSYSVPDAYMQITSSAITANTGKIEADTNTNTNLKMYANVSKTLTSNLSSLTFKIHLTE